MIIKWHCGSSHTMSEVYQYLAFEPPPIQLPPEKLNPINRKHLSWLSQSYESPIENNFPKLFFHLIRCSQRLLHSYVCSTFMLELFMYMSTSLITLDIHKGQGLFYLFGCSLETWHGAFHLEGTRYTGVKEIMQEVYNSWVELPGFGLMLSPLWNCNKIL